MAAGLSLKGEQVEEFRRRINEACTLSREELVPVLDFDGILRLQYAGEQLLKELELLEPYGKGNRQPLFAESGVHVVSGRVVGRAENVLKLQLETEQGAKVEGVYFGEAERMLEAMEEKGSFSMLYYPEVDEYMGKGTIQMVIKAIR